MVQYEIVEDEALEDLDRVSIAKREIELVSDM